MHGDTKKKRPPKFIDDRLRFCCVNEERLLRVVLLFLLVFFRLGLGHFQLGQLLRDRFAVFSSFHLLVDEGDLAFLVDIDGVAIGKTSVENVKGLRCLVFRIA